MQLGHQRPGKIGKAKTKQLSGHQRPGKIGRAKTKQLSRQLASSRHCGTWRRILRRPWRLFFSVPKTLQPSWVCAFGLLPMGCDVSYHHLVWKRSCKWKQLHSIRELIELLPEQRTLRWLYGQQTMQLGHQGPCTCAHLAHWSNPPHLREGNLSTVMAAQGPHHLAGSDHSFIVPCLTIRSLFFWATFDRMVA